MDSEGSNPIIVEDDSNVYDDTQVSNTNDSQQQRAVYQGINVCLNQAVQIANGYKSYRALSVLKNLNLNVPSGAIYGLLGPSGCGKTTILRCIVGRLTLDSGQVLVLGAEPGKRGHGIPGPLVGYMPQEITLFNEFNIEETLNFFGMLHNMEKHYVESRKQFLLEFLNLPPKNKLIKTLSGGQKRRVSMSIALLQEPKLLILDEPTVGVDPLLREKIWAHLLDISKTSGTTIMITTHYIEEARKADRVGLMRNGKLLAEDSPDFLLQKYNEPTLENVFLKLCIRDQGNSASSSGLANPNFEDTKEEKMPQVDFDPPPSGGKSFMSLAGHKLQKAFRPPKLHSFKGLIYKDFILMRRTIGFVFFQLLVPFIQISLFCLCIGREPVDLRFGIVNNETINNETQGFASLIFIDELSNTTFRKSFMNWSEAYSKTRKCELWGYIDLSVNFTQDTFAKFIHPTTTNDTFNGSNINLYIDSSNQQISLVVQQRILEAYQGFLEKIAVIFGQNPNLLGTPLVKTAIYGEADPQFIDFMAPGIMITVIFILSIGLTALIFVIEKKEGLLERTAVANVNTIELITAHTTMKLIIMIFQIVVLLFIAIIVFNVNMKGSFLLAGAFLALQGFCGMSLGMLISSVVNEESEALQVSIGIVFPAMLISGILWPVEGMPAWVQFISNFSPLRQSAEAVRSIASRGWGFTEWTTWFGFLTVVAWSLFFNIIALIFFNSEE